MIPNLYQANPNDSMGEQDSFYFQRCPQTSFSLSAIQRIGLVTHSFVLLLLLKSVVIIIENVTCNLL